jgi:hypothetical protein
MQESIKRISRMKGLSLVFVTIVVALLMRAGVAEAASWSVIPSPNGPSGDGLFYGTRIRIQLMSSVQ